MKNIASIDYIESDNCLCWCRSGLLYKNCHKQFDEKIEKYRMSGIIVPDHKIIKSQKDIDGIKRSAAINIACLDAVAREIGIGVSTEDINTIVYETTLSMGGIPACLDYHGFPKSVCTSVNDVVCHGIPSKEQFLKNGDIINIDCSTIFEGYYSDSCRMFCIGNVSNEKRRLVEVAKECVEIGLNAVVPWTTLGDIGSKINEHAIKNGYSVVREIGGHGIGLEFHEPPSVSFVSSPGAGMLMVPGMVFTIEPMINMGFPDIIKDANDGWTVYTQDGKPSAMWEIQVLVTDAGHEVLCW